MRKQGHADISQAITSANYAAIPEMHEKQGSRTLEASMAVTELRAQERSAITTHEMAIINIKEAEEQIMSSNTTPSPSHDQHQPEQSDRFYTPRPTSRGADFYTYRPVTHDINKITSHNRGPTNSSHQPTTTSRDPYTPMQEADGYLSRLLTKHHLFFITFDKDHPFALSSKITPPAPYYTPRHLPSHDEHRTELQRRVLHHRHWRHQDSVGYHV
jgi:hypothetical protein